MTRKSSHQAWTTGRNWMSLTLPLWRIRATASFGGWHHHCPMGRDFLHRHYSAAQSHRGQEVSQLSHQRAGLPFQTFLTHLQGFPFPAPVLSPLLQPHTGQWASAVPLGHRGSSVSHPDRYSLRFYRGPGLWFQHTGTQIEFLHCR